MYRQKHKNDKLIPISLPEICSPRTKLMGVYEKAAQNRCVYVHAPAGSGKTISTLLWLQQSGRDTIWLSLDVYDNVLAGFYRFFCTGLFSVIPHDEHLESVIKNPAFNTSPVEYTIEILSQLSFGKNRYAFVLDDFHHITDNEILKSLLYIMKRLPLSVTILFLSRNELPQSFSYYQESGRIAFITASELALKKRKYVSIMLIWAGFSLSKR